MTAYIVQVSQGDTPAGTLEYRTIFAVGLALFVTTMVPQRAGAVVCVAGAGEVRMSRRRISRAIAAAAPACRRRLPCVCLAATVALRVGAGGAVVGGLLAGLALADLAVS